MFTVITDSTSSIPVAELEKQNVVVVPLNTDIADKTYIDGVTLLPPEFYAKMAESLEAGTGLPKTSCPPQMAFEKAYKDAFDNGSDGVIVITLGSGISGTYNSAFVAADHTDEGEIRIIDSKSTIGGMDFLIEQAVKMRDAGKSVDEAATHLRTLVDNMALFVGIEDINNIVNGGRANPEDDLTAMALRVKLLITLDDVDGSVANLAKVKGTNALVKAMVENIEKFIAEHGESEIRFNTTTGADEVIGKVKERLDEAGIAYDNGECGWIGSVIGTHTGAGSYAVVLAPKSLLV